MELALLWTLIGVAFLVGLLGTVIPAVPGITLIYGAILIYAIATDFASIGVPTIAVFGAITVLALVADYAGSYFGARAGGSGWRGALGAGLGALGGGLFGGPIGLFLGAFAGAALGAMAEGLRGGRVMRTAAYAVAGVLGSAAVQLLLGVSMITAFFFALFF